jgi:hypothetical protein
MTPTNRQVGSSITTKTISSNLLTMRMAPPIIAEEGVWQLPKLTDFWVAELEDHEVEPTNHLAEETTTSEAIKPKIMLEVTSGTCHHLLGTKEVLANPAVKAKNREGVGKSTRGKKFQDRVLKINH